jgi:hypothetical protein
VTDEHYGTVGAALLWTLEKGLGARAFDQDPPHRESGRRKEMPAAVPRSRPIDVDTRP